MGVATAIDENTIIECYVVDVHEYDCCTFRFASDRSDLGGYGV